MDKNPHCQRCGVALAGQAVGSLCANCLLKLALEPPLQATNHDVRESNTDVGSTAMGAPLTEVPGTIIGRYKLREELGEGGFGVVYVAEQEEPVRRRVALKVIKLGMDTRQVVARFEAERQALAMMDHPNIAKVLDAGTTESGRPYFVMELVRGIRITDYCEKEKVSIEVRLNLFSQVCHAIQHAHQKGIIHRDIKPSNVLVTMHDGVPVPKVIDFGIAKATEGRLTDATVYTQLHQFMGTPAYMSPEQAEMSGLDIDTRSDIYSLGVLLYELLTSQTPFDAKELMAAGIDEMRRTIREVEPPRPSTRLTLQRIGDGKRPIAKFEICSHAEIPSDLDWVVMKCLEKDRTRRYETASGLAADIKRHLDNEPVVARPPSTAYRLQKAWRRNRFAYVGGATVAFALLAGTTLSTWQAVRATSARKSETQALQETERARAQADQERLKALASLKEARRMTYLADMSTVDQALGDNNITRARRILDQHRPRPDREDLRDWEWFYFERFAWTDESELIGTHPGGAQHLLSGIGEVFVTSGQASLGDSSKGPVQVWNSTRQKLLRSFVAPEDAKTVALSRDGKRLAIARVSQIEIRSLTEDFKLLKTLTSWRRQDEKTGHISTMRFTSGETQLVIAGQGGGGASPYPLTFVDIEADTSTPAKIAGSKLESFSLEISDDYKLGVALVGLADEILIFRLPSCDVVSRFKVDPLHTRPPIIVFPDKESVVISTGAGKIDLWDVGTGRRLRSIGEHAASITALALSADGRRLASAGSDQLVKVWDLKTNPTRVRLLRGHDSEVSGVTFGSDNQTLISCGIDGSVRTWNLQKDPPGDTAWPLPAGSMGAAFKNSSLVIEGPPLKFKVWDLSFIPEELEPRLIPIPSTFPDAGIVPLVGTSFYLVALSSVGPRAGWGIPIQLYRGRDEPKPVEAFPQFGVLGPQGVHCSQDRLYLHGRAQGEPHLLVWDLTEERIIHLGKTKSRMASAMIVAPDQSRVFLGDPNGGLECIEMATGTASIWTNAFPGMLNALALMPDDRTLFAGGLSGGLRKIDWPTRTFSELPASLHSISAMAISKTGTRLVTGDTLGMLRLWDVDTLREIAVLGRHQQRISGIYFQPDGRTMLSADAHELRIWHGGGEQAGPKPRATF